MGTLLRSAHQKGGLELTFEALGAIGEETVRRLEMVFFGAKKRPSDN
ncbi:MAG: hypothetical protein JWM68_5324 [Verrucomicrobiales bacterium]|nr:hypothetical protein [Verrucomicrobiales bacterium]